MLCWWRNLQCRWASFGETRVSKVPKLPFVILLYPFLAELRGSKWIKITSKLNKISEKQENCFMVYSV